MGILCDANYSTFYNPSFILFHNPNHCSFTALPADVEISELVFLNESSCVLIKENTFQ